MIGWISGRIISQKDSFVVLETGGVGYEIQVPFVVGKEWVQKKQGSLWIYTHFRQDVMELYGFLTKEEKSFFISLLKVNGIGPKMALSILNSASLDQFIQWIQKENVKAFMALPRVGKKMAQQIIITLKEKISETFVGTKVQKENSEKVYSALESLGFNSEEIRKVIHQMEWKDNLEEDIKQALVRLKSL